jgi:hypothetical protein
LTSSVLTRSGRVVPIATAKTKIEAALTKDFNYFGGSWAEINASDQPREGYFKVALILSPGVDYHWYREIPNGQWGHKPSIDSARLTDASGYLIYQPHRYFGSGMVGSVYKLVDGTEVTVYFNNQIIDQIRVYHDDGSYDIIMQ